MFKCQAALLHSINTSVKQQHLSLRTDDITSVVLFHRWLLLIVEESVFGVKSCCLNIPPMGAADKAKSR